LKGGKETSKVPEIIRTLQFGRTIEREVSLRSTQRKNNIVRKNYWFPK